MRFSILRHDDRFLAVAAFSIITAIVTMMAEANSVLAQVPSISCPPYEIEGTITPADTGVDTGVRQASVYVHTDGEPQRDHQVFATFTTSSGEPIGEPVVMTTDSQGRAVAPVPEGSTAVSFVAEGPDNPACLGPEPSVALEIAATSGSIPENEGFDDDVNPPGEPGLADTGPVTAGVVATAVLVGAVGCGLWIGRGRRVRVLGERPGAGGG